MYHKMNGISILAIKIDFMAWTYYVFTKTQLTHSNTEQITGSLPRLGALDNYWCGHEVQAPNYAHI